MRATLAVCALLIGCAAPNRNEKGAFQPDPNATPLEQKLGANPNNAQVNFDLGQASEAGGDLLRAEQYYLRAEALGIPADKIIPRILRVLVGAKRYDEALERCRKRLATHPNDRGTRFVEAALLVALERPKDAERSLTTLVRAKPEDAQAYLALGKLYRDGYNDGVRAREMFQKYLQLAPDGESAAAVRYELDQIMGPSGESQP